MYVVGCLVVRKNLHNAHTERQSVQTKETLRSGGITDRLSDIDVYGNTYIEMVEVLDSGETHERLSYNTHIFGRTKRTYVA